MRLAQKPGGIDHSEPNASLLLDGHGQGA